MRSSYILASQSFSGLYLMKAGGQSSSSPIHFSTNWLASVYSFRAESTQKRPFWRLTILVPDGIWTYDLWIRSLAD